MTRRRFPLLLDVLYVIALGVYVVAGVPLTPFHGDEAMQIYMSSDYVTAILNGRWSDLPAQPPYDIDTDGHLRLINGTVNRYAIGAAWQIAGYTANDLPPRPGWDWGLNYPQNVETNHRPVERALNAARLPSALFTAASIGVLFLLVRRLSGRSAAYVAAAVYALNPAILLNGRRALQEGSMLFFGLLTVWIAAWISRRERIPLWAWGALIVGGALTLASKHSGVVFIAAAWGWISVAALLKLSPATSPRGEKTRRVLVRFGALVVSGVIVLAGFVALSPALWNDPPARVVNLLEERSRLLDIQVAIDPLAPLTFAQRIEAALIQPAIAPPMFYELASWSAVEAISAESDRYALSIWVGCGSAVGTFVMALSGFGVVIAAWRWRTYAGVLIWLGVTLITLLVNPLPWQRYYLPLIPVLAVLVGVVVGELEWRTQRAQRKTMRGNSMKRIAMVMILVALLAACSGQATPTATLVPPTPIPPTEDISQDAVAATGVAVEIQQTVAFAPPGTLIPAGVGTVVPPDAPPFSFDRVLFTQTGGLAGVNVQIDVYANGRVIRDGVESESSAETITHLAGMLEAINFFNLSGQFMSPGAAADAFTYTLTVVKGGSHRTITSQDGYTPQELFDIYDAIRALGR